MAKAQATGKGAAAGKGQNSGKTTAKKRLLNVALIWASP